MQMMSGLHAQETQSPVMTTWVQKVGSLIVQQQYSSSLDNSANANRTGTVMNAIVEGFLWYIIVPCVELSHFFCNLMSLCAACSAHCPAIPPTETLLSHSL